MGQKMVTRFTVKIAILILFTGFLSFCNQAVLEDTKENGIITMDTDNSNSSSQTSQFSTGPIAAVYVPRPSCEWPDEQTIHILTPVFTWMTVPGATTYQYQIYRCAAGGGVGQRIYTSPYLPYRTPDQYGLQYSQVPPNVLSFGQGYWWSVRARIGTASSDWDSADFHVVQ
jgi:hypothetical protein